MRTFLNKTKIKEYTLHEPQFLRRPHLNNGNLPIQNSNKILKNRTNKITEIINNKYNLSTIHLSMLDNTNWNHDIKTKMTFLENDINQYKENKIYKYDFSNDIMVFASYPTDYSFLYTINKFLSYGIKKIYFIYSDTNFIDKNFSKLSLFKNINVHLIKIQNIGYDFRKYYEGIKLIKKNNDVYNKVWLINDSFLITKWNFFLYNLSRETNSTINNDIIGSFLSFEKKKHLQSYLLIINSNILERYYNYLKTYKFIKINTLKDKIKIVDDLEIGLYNNIDKTIKCGVLFQVKRRLNININPTCKYGYYCGILKKEMLKYNSFLLHLNHNELFLIVIFLLKKLDPDTTIIHNIIKNN